LKVRTMQSKNRSLIIALLIVALASISGAYGESASVGRGSSVAVSEGSSAKGILASDGSITQSSVSSVGFIADLNIDPWVKNTKGDYAEIGVTGKNIGGLTYRDDYYPGKGSGWVSDAVWAQQWIGASSADLLHAYSYASNAAGDEANGEITIKFGSMLKDYYSSAYAGPAQWLGVERGAFVKQTSGTALGENILISTWAKNAINDQAGSQTEITKGTLKGYSATACAVKYSNGLRAAGVQTDWVSAMTLYGSIDQIMCAKNNWGDTSLVETSIDNGYLNSYPYSTNYPSIALSISDWRWTDATQSVDASSASAGFGDSIHSDGKSYNTIYGPNSYSKSYSNSRIKFWNSASTRPYQASVSGGLLV
jgi:hypothetical protein